MELGALRTTVCLRVRRSRRCAGAPDCLNNDDVLMTVEDCPLGVSYGEVVVIGTVEGRRSRLGR